MGRKKEELGGLIGGMYTGQERRGDIAIGTDGIIEAREVIYGDEGFELRFN